MKDNLSNYLYILSYAQTNALVICNHSTGTVPQPQGIWLLIQQIPAKSPTLQELQVGKTTAVFPRSLLSFHFSALFVYIKQTPSISPHCLGLGKTFVKAPLPRLFPPPPPTHLPQGEWRVLWLQGTLIRAATSIKALA